jgi:hypothetical protein
MSAHYGNTATSGGKRKYPDNVHGINPHGVSPTFGSLGSYGATGLELPKNLNKERLDNNCTINPFLYPVYEYDGRGRK